VEELKGRRMRLHLGMCKLLREDLALQADRRLANLNLQGNGDAKRFRDSIAREFDDLARKHESVGEAAFNDDVEYKRLMNEAIDGKAHALLKMDVYLESLAAAASDRAALDHIRNTPLADFADPSVVLPLRTGITHFPWVAVIKDKSPEIDLGDWDAAPVPAQARELIAGALGANTNIRVVTVKGGKLALSEGWATKRLEWAEKQAVQALPTTVAFLLRNCGGLTSLDLRCYAYGS
jgi:hypothetical protein